MVRMVIRKIIPTIILFIWLNASADLINLSKENYYQENPSPERQKILDLITNQFNNKTISQDILDELWLDNKVRNEQKLIRIQIINQQLYFKSFNNNSYYSKILRDFFTKLIQKYKIPNIDFIIISRDNLDNVDDLSAKKIINANVFMMSKNLKSLIEKDKFLIPDAFMIEDYWLSLIQKIKKENIVWENKKNMIFWRGSPNGSLKTGYYDSNGYHISNMSSLPRLSLVLFSKIYPQMIDAKFSYRINAKQGKKMAESIDILFNQDYQRASEEEHLKYKYLISIDGNTCAWLRVPWIMLSNSVLLKQNSHNIEWFYPALKAYYNFIPVSEDLSDLFSKIEWMKLNDEKLKIISLNAQKFVENNLMPEDIEKQMVIILNEYSKIQIDKDIGLK